jgi:hypothetical protein
VNGGRQLHLFKGKRQRGVKPPAPKEFASHVVIADMLRRWCVPGWIWTHFPAGEDRGHVTVMRKGKPVTFSPAASRLKRMGLRPGFPDFLFFSKTRACAFLELKRKGETTSDDQDEVIAFMRDAGHAVLTTDSVPHAVTFLKAIGVLRAGVEVW